MGDKESKGGCEQVCNKDGTEALCACGEEYELKEDGKTCEELHPCDKKGNAGCSQVCNKEGAEATCSCEEDFTLEQDGKTCVRACALQSTTICEKTCESYAEDPNKCSALTRIDKCTCPEGYTKNEESGHCEKPLQCPCIMGGKT